MQISFFLPFLPEAFLLTMIAFLICLGGITRSHLLIYRVTQSAILGTALLTSLQLLDSSRIITLSGAFVTDPLANISKLALYASTFLGFLYAKPYLILRKIPLLEYYVLGLFALLGMMVLVSAYNLLSIFLGLELLSLPLYALTALWHESKLALEASIKYFIMGVLASGILLYGFSFIYGATQQIDIGSISRSIHLDLLTLFAISFIVIGWFFKLGIAPFHQWVPDVYQGAPNPVTMFIGSAPKIATLVLGIRLLGNSLHSLYPQWQVLLFIAVLLSILAGNIIAIAQTNFKRMIGYSAISHMGYMLLGFLTGQLHGYAASIMYAIAYTIMTLVAFAILVVLSSASLQEIENVEDLKGLSQRYPGLAFLLLLAMFSMAGIPPSIGFFAKLSVLEALITVHLEWVAVFTLISSVIGAYYYLRVVKIMYFDTPTLDCPSLGIKVDTRIALYINGIAILLLGIFPGSLFQVCQWAIAQSLI